MIVLWSSSIEIYPSNTQIQIEIGREPVCFMVICSYGFLTFNCCFYNLELVLLNNENMILWVSQNRLTYYMSTRV